MRQRLFSLQFVVGRGGLSPKGLFDGFAQGGYAQEAAVRELAGFDVFQVAFGQDEGVEAHLGSFFDAAQGLRDAADVAVRPTSPMTTVRLSMEMSRRLE